MKEQRTYKEIMNDLQTAKYGKECRKLHKELKQIDRRNGLPLFMRYPKFPDIVMEITLVATVVVLVIRILSLLPI